MATTGTTRRVVIKDPSQPKLIENYHMAMHAGDDGFQICKAGVFSLSGCM
jgi:hypothetical protein